MRTPTSVLTLFVLFSLSIAQIVGCREQSTFVSENMPVWIHPKRCAIRNDTSRDIKQVKLINTRALWSSGEQSIPGRETKFIDLPEGELPNPVGVTWDVTENCTWTLFPKFENVPPGYDGDILFVITEQGVTVETAELGN